MKPPKREHARVRFEELWIARGPVSGLPDRPPSSPSQAWRAQWFARVRPRSPWREPRRIFTGFPCEPACSEERARRHTGGETQRRNAPNLSAAASVVEDRSARQPGHRVRYRRADGRDAASTFGAGAVLGAPSEDGERLDSRRAPWSPSARRARTTACDAQATYATSARESLPVPPFAWRGDVTRIVIAGVTPGAQRVAGARARGEGVAIEVCASARRRGSCRPCAVPHVAIVAIDATSRELDVDAAIRALRGVRELEGAGTRRSRSLRRAKIGALAKRIAELVE